MQEQSIDKQELYNKLFEHLYNIFDTEVRKDLLERGFIYFSYNDTIKEVCTDLAENKKEYDYYILIYHDVLEHVKKYFIEDINRINYEKRQIEERKAIKKSKKENKNKFTIFGVHPLVAILLFPIVIFFSVLDSSTKNK